MPYQFARKGTAKLDGQAANEGFLVNEHRDPTQKQILLPVSSLRRPGSDALVSTRRIPNGCGSAFWNLTAQPHYF